MPYISNLLGKPVVDVEGERIGPLGDLIATSRAEMRHPEVVALVVERRGGNVLVPFPDVSVLVAPACVLRKSLGEVTPYQPGAEDLYLARDVLDKQIIDTNGVRVVRVNDLELVRVNEHFYVANVDIGGLGLLRRLGLARAGRRVWASASGARLRPTVISWDDVELLPGDQPMRLKVPSDKHRRPAPGRPGRDHQRPEPRREQQAARDRST